MRSTPIWAGASLLAAVLAVPLAVQAADVSRSIQEEKTASVEVGEPVNEADAAAIPEVAMKTTDDKKAVTDKQTANKVNDKDKQQSKKSQQNDKSKKKPEGRSNAPIVIEADKLSFSDLSGDMFAQGNVRVQQNRDYILTDAMRGNAKKTEVWIDGTATMVQPLEKVKMVGTSTYYNYTTHLGNMKDIQGMVGDERLTGHSLEFYPEKMVGHDATMTRCPAKVPDYHVSAEKVEIWPGEKLIAYNAKFWIKNTVIYSTAKYQKSLDPNSQSEFPRVGYTSEDGFYIQQYFEYPLTDNVAAFTDLGYFSKRGFKPTGGLVQRTQNYTLTLTQGDYRDSDSHWVTKEPELRFEYNTKRIGETPFSYTFTAIYGKWTDEVKSSWHQDYTLYFSRDGIQLNENLLWTNGFGLEWVHESYDNSSQNIFKYNTALYQRLSPKLTIYGGYNYTKNNQSLFSYNSTTLGRELVAGFTYKLDRMNTIAYTMNYDITNSRLDKRSYTWYRNLHCWKLAISYKPMENQRITWDLSTTRW